MRTIYFKHTLKYGISVDDYLIGKVLQAKFCQCAVCLIGHVTPCAPRESQKNGVLSALATRVCSDLPILFALRERTRQMSELAKSFAEKRYSDTARAAQR